MGRFWIFFLSHTAPGFQLWFYFHLCMWVVHWGLLLRLPWRTWVCPCEGQVWRWYSCLGSRGSGSTRYWAIHSRILAWRTPLPDREAWQATVFRVTKSQTLLKRPCMHRCKTFFACGSSAPVRVECEGHAAAWLAGTLVVSSVQRHGLPLLQGLWPYLSLLSSLL